MYSKNNFTYNYTPHKSGKTSLRRAIKSNLSTTPLNISCIPSMFQASSMYRTRYVKDKTKPQTDTEREKTVYSVDFLVRFAQIQIFALLTSNVTLGKFLICKMGINNTTYLIRLFFYLNETI